MACNVIDDCDADIKVVAQFFDDCYQGRTDNVQRALESGIDPNCQTHARGEYPLHRACLQDKSNITEKLICWGARVDSVIRDDGDTPLHYAARYNNKKCVKLLTKHRCKTDIKNKAGNIPIEEAKEKTHKEIVRLLKTVAESQQKDPEPFSLPMYPSIKQLSELKLGDDDWIKLGIALGLEKGCLEEMRSSTQAQKLMFLEAKKKSNFIYHDVVKALIELELWDVVEEIREEHWDEYSSVSMSAYFGSVKYFDYLVAKKHCDPKAELIDVKGQSMLTHTCTGGHLEFIVNLIDKHNFSPDEPLNNAADTIFTLSAKNVALRDYFHKLQQKDAVDKVTEVHNNENSSTQASEEAASKDVNNVEACESAVDTENEPFSKPAPQKTCLKKLRSILWDVRAKWDDLAIELDIPLGTREAIKEDESGVERRFTVMLEAWLKESRPIHLDMLVDALQSKPVGRGDVAEILKEKITNGEIIL